MMSCVISGFSLQSFQFRLQSRKSSPPRAPTAIPCRSKRCSHVKTFGNHYDKEEWDEYKHQDQQYRWRQLEEERRRREDRDSDQ